MDEVIRSRLNAEGGSAHYDRAGTPIGLGDWIALREDPGYWCVARTTVAGHTISTVWLGLDHGFGFGPAVIFETMVFADGEPGRDWDLQKRYATEEDALAGHEATVAHVELLTGAVRADIPL